MSTRLFDITLDFSEYLSEKKIFINNFYDKETLKFIIDKLLDLDLRTKKLLHEKPPIFICNGRKLDSNLSLRYNRIISGDKILVCLPKIKAKSKLVLQDEIITTINNTETMLNIKSKDIPLNKEIKEKKEKRSLWLVIKAILSKNKKWLIPLIILCLIFIGIGIYLKLKLRKSNEEDYSDEKLISKLDYKIYQVYNLLNKKDISTIVEPTNMKNLPYKNKTFNISEYVHYTLGIEKENIELDEISKIKKKYYSGFLAINNIAFENETDIMINLYLNSFNNAYLRYLEEYNKKRNQNNDKQVVVNIINEKNFTQPIIKFDFYKNGKIKEIYIPNNLEDFLFTSLYELLNNFIPNLNERCDNISKELHNIKEEEEKEETEEENNEDNEEEEKEEENNDFEEEKDRRILNGENRIITKYKIKIIEKSDISKKRGLNQNLDLDLNKSAYTIETNIKEIEYIDNSDEKNEKSIELREYKSYDANNLDINNSATFISQYKQGLAGNPEGQYLKNSSKIIWSNIEINDELGIIKLINLNTSVELNNYEDIEENQKENNLKNIINENYLNSAEDNNDKYKENNKTEEIDTNIKSSFNQLKYITNESIINKDDYININKTIINELKDYFNKYNYKLYSDTSYGNKTLRILNHLSKYVNEKICLKKEIIIENITINQYRKDKKEKKLRKLIEDYSDTYYGLRDIDISKNAYRANILGLILQGDIENKITQKDGTTASSFHSYYGKTKISYSVSDIQTNSHIIVRNTNEMVKCFINILYDLENDLIERNKNYNKIILNLEKNISLLIDKNNLYDFSRAFVLPLNNMYNEVKNFTSNLFKDLLIIIDQAHSNYSLLFNKIKENNLFLFNQIKQITKKEYLEYIKLSLNDLVIFKNNTLKYINELEILIQNISNFQIDVLYDIKDNIEEAKKIFKNFCTLLFNSITKRIKIFKIDLSEYMNEIIGEILFITEFISSGLKNDDILRNALDEKTKVKTINKLQEFKIIIESIINTLFEEIFDEYDNEMSISNIHSIKYLAENKKSNLLEEINNNSNNLIESIKLKIKYIEKYELYSSNIDKINEINYNVENQLYSNSNEKIMKNFSSIKPEFLVEASDIINNKNKLFNISILLKNEINNDINIINDYINAYSNKYKNENIYHLYLNLSHFRKSFLDESMNNLLNDFFKLINDTVKIHLKQTIKYNYDLGFEYLNDELNYFKKYKHKKREIITSEFISKFYRFVENNKNFLSLTYTSDLIEIFEENFFNLRDEVLKYVKDKISSINKYYFDNKLYSNLYYYISQVSNEILKIIDNINNYYHEMKFDSEIQSYILNIIKNTLPEYDDQLDKEFQKLYDHIYSISDKIKKNRKDFCWSRWRTLKGWKNYYLYTKHTNNIKKVINNLNSTKSYIINNKNKIYQNFINKFSKYLDSCVNISQNLYTNLFSYVENKINNCENINTILKQYENTFYYMINNNSNYELINKLSEKQINNINFNINYTLNELTNGLKTLKNEYYINHYLKNKTEFLEYPYEIIIKCKQIIKELDNNSDNIKTIINNRFREKIIDIIKETNNFIRKINNDNYYYIMTHLNYSYIIKKYINKKKEVITLNFELYELLLNDLEIEVVNNFNFSLLNNFKFTSKFNNIINKAQDFIYQFKQAINQEFTQIICKNITDLSSEEFIYLYNNHNITDNINGIIYNNSDIDCKLVYFESELNYSKYNYQIVKIRNALYYTRNLYEELNYIEKKEEKQEILNIKNIKEEDDKLNNKNIWIIYNESLNSLIDLNEESKKVLKDYYEFFLEDFLLDFSIYNDKNRNIYISNIQILNDILQNKYMPFSKMINDELFKKELFMDEQLEIFNSLLEKYFSQINFTIFRKIDYYSIEKAKLIIKYVIIECQGFWIKKWWDALLP